MPSLLAVSLFARVAITAAAMALMMHVVRGMEMSYAAAGGVVAMLTAGLAVGGPLLGRVIDRRGVRVVLSATAAAQAVFWASVPQLPYGLLLFAALAGGVLMVPVQAVTRQAIAVMTTEGRRRAAFALESVQGEVSYTVGPPLVILCAAEVSTGFVAYVVGAVVTAGGAGLALLDPPVRPESGADAGPAVRPSRREWLGPGMAAVLVMAFGTTMLLSGADLAIVAVLEEAGQISRAAVVVTVYGLASITGGLVYGALSRPVPTWVPLALLGLATVPAGLAHDWRWLCVAVGLSGLLAAPALSAVADAVSRLAPPGARGEATGLQSSAQSAGFALGSPATGTAVDLTAPAGGFAAAGLSGLVAALAGCLLLRRAPARADVSGGAPALGEEAPAAREPH